MKSNDRDLMEVAGDAEPAFTRNPPGWFRVAAVYADTLIPEQSDGPGWRMYPCRLPDRTAVVALEAYQELGAIHLDEEDQAVQPPDRFALVIEVAMEAQSADRAIELALPLIDRLIGAVGFLQMGRGPRLALFALAPDGMLDSILSVFRPGVITRKGEHMPDLIESTQIGLSTNPQAELFASLYAEACRDSNASSSITRLWFILEALAERFKGHRYNQVRTLAAHIGMAGPRIAGDPPEDLLERAWQTRVAFAHGSKATGDANVQLGLARFTQAALSECGFRAVDPKSLVHPRKGVRFVEIHVPAPPRLSLGEQLRPISEFSGARDDA